MGSPEPEPLPDDSEDEPAADAPIPERPSWLVGAEEGFEGEASRAEAVTHEPKSGIVLHRPGGGIVDREALAHHPPVAPEPPRAAAPPSPPPAVAWKAAASSIPILRVAPDLAPRAEIESEAPGADPGEAEPELDAKRFPAAQSLRPVPPPKGPAAPTALRPPPPRTKMPWDDALEALRLDRRLQILVLGVLVLIVAAVAFWPRKSPPTSIGSILRHASQFDGRSVEVRGRVGDVFPFGGGWTYYLTQGKSSIVIYARVRRPSPRETITVRGTVSAGYMDGKPRLAIFEDPEN